MKRILTLTSNDFYTGISAGQHVDRGGLFNEADGVNVFVDYSAGSTNAGLLQSCSSPTVLTGTMTGNPTDYAVDDGYLWAVTDDGEIVKQQLNTDDAVTVVETGILNMGTGCEVFLPKGGSKYLYYFNNNDQIGRHDLTTTQADSWVTGLNTTTATSTTRPIHKFKDRLYFSNIYEVGTIYDDGAADATHQKNSLDLPEETQITALEDDGTYLVIAATENDGFNPLYYQNTRIFFWDTNQSSWTREFTIQDPYISSLKRVGDRIYAIGVRGLYVFSFQSRPYKIRSLDESDVTSNTAVVYHGAVGVYNNAVMWGASNARVHTYGENMQGIGVSNVMHTPFGDDTYGSTTMIASEATSGAIITGTNDGELLKWNPATGGQTGVTADTVYIPLNEQTTIREIEIVLGEPMASGDSLNIDVQSDEDVAATDWGTISYTKHGAVKRVKLKGSKRNVDNLKLIFNFDGGNVKIKRINVYGSAETVAPR